MVVEKLLSALEARGMAAHIGPGKTAAIIVPREEQTCQLAVTDQYRHLGGIVSARQGSQEHVLRTGEEHEISSETKGCRLIHERVFQATVVAALQWGAGTWPKLNLQETRAFETACWELYKNLLPCSLRRQSVVISHEEILLYLSVDMPEALIASAHARHYCTMIKAAPDMVWSLLHEDPRAKQAYQEAFGWMQGWLDRDRDQPPFDGLEEMTAHIQTKAAIKRALHWSRQYHRMRAEVYTWHRDIHEELGV